MLFHTVEFFAFLAVVMAAFYAVPLRFGRFVLLAASYAFYMHWNARLVLLLFVLTVIDYAVGLALHAAGPRRRRWILLISLGANLAFLGFFKYFNFLAGILAGILRKPADTWFLDILLPVGISFHTFQSMSYVVDVYRGKQKPVRNFPDYALYIAFFPQLVAGPIVRARDFFRDLYPWRAPSKAEIEQGMFDIVVGLIKKMVIADQFALVSDAYFRDVHAAAGMLPAWSGAFAFAMQIFFDFSGYTDMAIGCAKLFGFRFPQNFARPYLSASITEFWRRWHISLSSWLRDYLYIPLGGNRESRWNTYRNLMITMLLGGLWHGARWNFVIWGGYHGALLAIERMFRREAPADGTRRDWFYPARAAATFVLVLIGWVFFRATSFSDAAYVLAQMFHGERGSCLLAPGHFLLVAVSTGIALIQEKSGILDKAALAPRWAQACALTIAFICLELFSVVEESIPFVYFQF